ncbi:hypothetical protein B0J14DRAFT_570615 [Halenospora varia]|nr:hypothetical protein B0J14DRAFT_570615 [Halenospora varia]
MGNMNSHEVELQLQQIEYSQQSSKTSDTTNPLNPESPEFTQDEEPIRVNFPNLPTSISTSDSTFNPTPISTLLPRQSSSSTSNTSINLDVTDETLGSDPANDFDPNLDFDLPDEPTTSNPSVDYNTDIKDDISAPTSKSQSHQFPSSNPSIGLDITDEPSTSSTSINSDNTIKPSPSSSPMPIRRSTRLQKAPQTNYNEQIFHRTLTRYPLSRSSKTSNPRYTFSSTEPSSQESSSSDSDSNPASVIDLDSSSDEDIRPDLDRESSIASASRDRKMVGTTRTGKGRDTGVQPPAKKPRVPRAIPQNKGKAVVKNESSEKFTCFCSSSHGHHASKSDCDRAERVNEHVDVSTGLIIACPETVTIRIGDENGVKFVANRKVLEVFTDIPARFGSAATAKDHATGTEKVDNNMGDENGNAVIMKSEPGTISSTLASASSSINIPRKTAPAASSETEIILPHDLHIPTTYLLSYLQTGTIIDSLDTASKFICTSELSALGLEPAFETFLAAIYVRSSSFGSPQFQNFLMEKLRQSENVMHGTWPQPDNIRSLYTISGATAKDNKILLFVVSLVAASNPLSTFAEETHEYEEWMKLFGEVQGFSIDVHRASGQKWHESKPWDDKYAGAWMLEEESLGKRLKRVLGGDSIWGRKNWKVADILRSLLETRLSDGGGGNGDVEEADVGMEAARAPATILTTQRTEVQVKKEAAQASETYQPHGSASLPTREEWIHLKKQQMKKKRSSSEQPPIKRRRLEWELADHEAKHKMLGRELASKGLRQMEWVHGARALEALRISREQNMQDRYEVKATKKSKEV